MTEYYNKGDTVRLKATFYDWNDTPVNVTGCTLKIYDANENVIETVETASLHTGTTGQYYYDWTVTETGLIVYEFSGTYDGHVILRRDTINAVFVEVDDV